MKKCTNNWRSWPSLNRQMSKKINQAWTNLCTSRQQLKETIISSGRQLLAEGNPLSKNFNCTYNTPSSYSLLNQLSLSVYKKKIELFNFKELVAIESQADICKAVFQKVCVHEHLKPTIYSPYL